MPTFGSGTWGGGDNPVVSSNAIAVEGICDEALRYAGVTMGPGRIPSADQKSDAFLAFQRLLNSWEARRLLILTTIRSTYALVAAQSSYLIGPEAADWIGYRPTKILRAGIVVDDVETSIGLFDDAQWASVYDKTLTGTPLGIRYEPTTPTGTVYPWPVPDTADSIALYVWSPMTAIGEITESVDLAPAYADAIVFNLALRLISKFKLAPDSFVIQQARETLAVIESLNNPPPPKLTSAFRGGHFDIQSGTFR